MSILLTKSNMLWKRFRKSGIMFFLSVFILFTGFGEATAQNKSPLQDKTLLSQVLSEQTISDEKLMSINFTKVTLERAFEILADRLKVGFSYNPDLMPNKIVSFEMSNVQAYEIIYKLLEGTNLEPVLPPSRDVIILREKDVQIIPEIYQERVTGTVVDAQTGEALPGVNVIVMGSAEETGSMIGTTTNVDGEFELSVPTLEETLVFSFIGYERLVVEIAGRTELNIQLMPDIQMLGDLVVVGYGTQRQMNVTGSVSNINSESIEHQPITNSSQALSGKASGVWVSQNSGRPGDDEAQIRVRGWGTMNNSEPLIIIDGVEGSFDQLNHNDIENISILKDASSAAIYGSRAANGVVLITTKGGEFNKDLEVNFSSYVGVQQLGRRYDMVSNSADYMELWNEALTNEGSSPLFSDDLISNFRNGNDPHRFPNTDWFNEVYRTAPIQENNLSISGGSSQISAFLSLNYLNQNGIIRNTDSERYGIRANLEARPVEWLNLGLRLNYQKTDSNEPYQMGERVFTRLTTTYPFIAPYTEDGQFGGVEATDADGNPVVENWNPLMSIHNGGLETEKEITNLNVNARLDITDNLYVNTTLSTRGIWNLTSEWNQRMFSFTSSGVQEELRNREGIERSRNHIKTVDNNIYSTINFIENFGQNHEFIALGGFEYQSNTIKDVGAFARDPLKDILTQVDAATTGQQVNGNLLGLRTLSYFARLNYAFADKYLFEANLRRDASSRFKKENRWGTFPGFSVGWRIIEEDFMQNINFISNLRLRASWGQLGNQNIAGFWPYLTVINQNNNLSYSYGGSFESGMAVTNLVDENVTWESTTSMDIGLHIGLLENRFNVEATYFSKVTEDILVQLPIPQILGGVSSPIENVGEMENKGLEFIFGYNKPAQNRDKLGLKIDGNITYTTNEVTKFRGGDSPDQLFLIREGYSFNSLYGFNVEGIYQTDAEASDHMHSNSVTPRAGNLRYEDVNNDGRLDFQDRQVLGNTIPKWTFGFSPTLQWKGFDLKMLFQGTADLTVNTQNGYLEVSQGNPMLHSMWKNAWTSQNTDTRIPSIKLNNTWDQQDSNFWMHDISYVKMKNIQLGYTFSNFITRLGLRELYVYANGQNLFTIVDAEYPGFDPERDTFGSGQNIYPTPRIITMGFNIKF